jgi:hypothetical protein
MRVKVKGERWYEKKLNGDGTFKKKLFLIGGCSGVEQACLSSDYFNIALTLG